MLILLLTLSLADPEYIKPIGNIPVLECEYENDVKEKYILTKTNGIRISPEPLLSAPCISTEGKPYAFSTNEYDIV